MAGDGQRTGTGGDDATGAGLFGSVRSLRCAPQPCNVGTLQAAGGRRQTECATSSAAATTSATGPWSTSTLLTAADRPDTARWT